MRHHYRILLEKELDRLCISQETVIVLSLGKDKFIVTDGRRSFKSKGHLIYRKTRKLHDRAGYSRFWNAVKDFPTYIEKVVLIPKTN